MNSFDLRAPIHRKFPLNSKRIIPAHCPEKGGKTSTQVMGAERRRKGLRQLTVNFFPDRSFKTHMVTFCT